jgi:outer membrane lipoprotein LolB
MRLRAPAALGTAAVLVLLAGCRTAPAPAPAVPGPGADAPWSEQYAALATLDGYALTGRVAVAANGQGFSANLRYRQQQQRADLALDGPMGIGGLRMEFDARELKVTSSRGETLNGAAARAEVESRLGFELPLAELRWWLLGLPAPGMPAEKHEAAGGGAITDFAQNGWRVSIHSRAPGLGFSLPERLTAEREGARLKLLVESWQ